jgi:hypothetical protein
VATWQHACIRATSSRKDLREVLSLLVSLNSKKYLQEKIRKIITLQEMNT